MISVQKKGYQKIVFLQVMVIRDLKILFIFIARATKTSLSEKLYKCNVSKLVFGLQPPTCLCRLWAWVSCLSYRLCRKVLLYIVKAVKNQRSRSFSRRYHVWVWKKFLYRYFQFKTRKNQECINYQQSSFVMHNVLIAALFIIEYAYVQPQRKFGPVALMADY